MDTGQNRRGSGCHELRILDGEVTWRIVYAVEADLLVILDVLPRDPAAPEGLTVTAGVAC